MSPLLDIFKKTVQPKSKRVRPRQGMVLALEMGSGRIKMALFERRDNTLTLKRFGWRETPTGKVLEKGHALRELLEELRPPNTKVAVSITGPHVAVRFIQLPKMTSEEVRDAVRYEAEKYIPFKLDEVILDSQILREEGSKSRVLLVAAKRQSIVSLIQVLKEAGLDPVLIDVDVFCLVNAFLENYEAPKETLALLHIGAATTTISIIQSGILIFTREIPLAGDQLTQEIAEHFGASPRAAERLKLSPGDRAEEIREAQQPFFDRFINEIRLTFDFFENQFESSIGQVCLSGGASLSDDLYKALEEGLRIKMDRWNPFQKIAVAPEVDPGKVKEWSVSLGVCVGLVLRGV
jgi:type IV pilus assembly protein PilM